MNTKQTHFFNEYLASLSDEEKLKIRKRKTFYDCII